MAPSEKITIKANGVSYIADKVLEFMFDGLCLVLLTVFVIGMNLCILENIIYKEKEFASRVFHDKKKIITSDRTP
jgi:hypothetical protein